MSCTMQLDLKWMASAVHKYIRSILKVYFSTHLLRIWKDSNQQRLSLKSIYWCKHFAVDKTHNDMSFVYEIPAMHSEAGGLHSAKVITWFMNVLYDCSILGRIVQSNTITNWMCSFLMWTNKEEWPYSDSSALHQALWINLDNGLIN